MAALPYMQLYVAEYLADTAHLSAVEHGAYLLLIMNYWQRGKALPAEPRKLARVARVSDDEWTDIADTLFEFFEERDGFWHHKRIDADLEAVEAKSQKARNARAQRASNERATVVGRPSNHKDKEQDKEQKIEKAHKRVQKPQPKNADDWQLDDAGREYAVKAGIMADRVPAMAEKFKLHHKAKGNTFKDWHAAWCKWVRQDAEWKQSQAPPSPFPQKKPYREILAERRAANGNA